MLSFIAIGINCAAIYWTSKTLPIILNYSYDATDSFMIIILIEHIIIGAKILLSVIIKDRPEWVLIEEREQEQQMEELYNILDHREKEFRDRGGVPISETI
jgi:hypothetical protein